MIVTIFIFQSIWRLRSGVGVLSRSCIGEIQVFLSAVYSGGLVLNFLRYTEGNIFKNEEWGFPGGSVVESLPASAGNTGSSPGLGGSHMPQSNWAREPQLLSLRVWSLCSATREAAIVRGPRTAMKSGPHLPQLEKALVQKRRPNTAKKKEIN